MWHGIFRNAFIFALIRLTFGRSNREKNYTSKNCCEDFPDTEYFNCPEHFRHIIGRHLCKDQSRYHCLLTERDPYSYVNSCNYARQIVTRGRFPKQDNRTRNLSSGNCPDSYFQPQHSWSNEQSKCIYKRSPCNEEGQVTYSDGSSTTDRQCTCDHTNGYAFLTTPIQKKFCIPSKEDCTCYKKGCSINEYLTKDYNCEKGVPDRCESVCATVMTVCNSAPLEYTNGTSDNHGTETELEGLRKSVIHNSKLAAYATAFLTVVCFCGILLGHTILKNLCSDRKGTYMKPLDMRTNPDENETPSQQRSTIQALKAGGNGIKPVSSYGRHIKDYTDIVIVYIKEDKSFAKNYIGHLNNMRKSQDSISTDLRLCINLFDEMTEFGHSRECVEKALSNCKYIFIYVSRNFSIAKLRKTWGDEMYKHLRKEFIENVLKCERIRVVCIDGFDCIPSELSGLNILNYSEYLTTENKTKSIYQKRVQHLFFRERFN